MRCCPACFGLGMAYCDESWPACWYADPWLKFTNLWTRIALDKLRHGR